MMRSAVWVGLVAGKLLVNATCSGQETSVPLSPPVPLTANPPVSAGPVDPKLDALLDAWSQAAAGRKTVQATIERVDQNRKWGDRAFGGQVIFRRSDLVLEFHSALTDAQGKPRYRTEGERQILQVSSEPNERIVWTAQEVKHFNWDVKEVCTFPLESKPASLFATMMARARQTLDLPFLHQIPKADLYALYEMTIMEEKAETNTATIRFRHRGKADRELFGEAFVMLEGTTWLPTTLVLIPSTDRSRQVFRFRDIRVNEPILDALFATASLPPGWKAQRVGGPVTDWLIRLDQWGEKMSEQPARTRTK